MTRQIIAVDNHRLGDAELAELRASLQEHREFRHQQLRAIARGSTEVDDQTRSRQTAAHLEVRRKLVLAARMALEEIEAALARMDTGRYGRCSRCGRGISRQRLRAHPQASYCTSCHQAVETAQ